MRLCDQGPQVRWRWSRRSRLFGGRRVGEPARLGRPERRVARLGGGGDRRADRRLLLRVQRANGGRRPPLDDVVDWPLQRTTSTPAARGAPPDLGLGERPGRTSATPCRRRRRPPRPPAAGSVRQCPRGHRRWGSRRGTGRASQHGGIHRRDAHARPPQQRLGDLARARPEVEHLAARVGGENAHSAPRRGGRAGGGRTWPLSA